MARYNDSSDFPRFADDALEQNALEVLGLIRSMKNTFALVNRTPPDILSLIPEYWDRRERDKNVIRLTHVCRGWRDLFTLRPLLWNRLGCVDVDKTRAYLERSKSSPLEIILNNKTDALFLAGPHIGRVKSLTIIAVRGDVISDITTHFSRPAPLLEYLSIAIRAPYIPVLDCALFNRDLPSVRTLELEGVVTELPWRDLSNLTSFSLNRTAVDKISITILLDFFEHASMLRRVTLVGSIPIISNAPPERVVSLPRLEGFVICGSLPYSTLLNHLSIPPNAATTMTFDLINDRLPIQDHHPKSLVNFGHLSYITQINVGLRGKPKLIQLYGPSGSHHIQGKWVGVTGFDNCPVTVDTRMLQSVVTFDTSNVERFAITQYPVSPHLNTEESPPYHVLFRMGNLRTLTLTECHNLLFFAALNPEKTPHGVILCLGLTELILHVHLEKRSCLKELWEMAKARDSRGVRLQSVTIICTQQVVLPKEVFKLRQYVPRVEYRLEDEFPEWNVVVPAWQNFGNLFPSLWTCEWVLWFLGWIAS